MSLTNEERQILVQRELEKAHEAYEDIEILKARGRWNGAANRFDRAVNQRKEIIYNVEPPKTMMPMG